ncbi:MAG: hypothetical protein U1E78_10430 [Gammaproteobacteria bacterium]
MLYVILPDITCLITVNLYPQQLIFRVGAERSRRRSVHKVHDCDENREGNNPENSAVKGISSSR